MTLEDIFNCSRPLYLDSGIEGFDYGQGGSCFLLRSGDRLWVMTARHCLWQNLRVRSEDISSRVENLWIPQSLRTDSRLSFEFTNAHVGWSTTHSAAFDFAVIEISCDPRPDTSEFYDLATTPLRPPQWGDKLVIGGYLGLINEIEYPDDEHDGKLKPLLLMASGTFAGEGTAPMLNAMRLDAPETLASYRGMSGSPVFLVRTEGHLTFAEWAGMAVRQMISAGTIDFIPSLLLRRALDGWQRK